ncbi:peptidylprolyl isomerase [Jejuia spongiicola]|uniref:peptidylprolyl isomerase n=1 Tax=Jejuia spongiicola TaxID=2942207 RepID=A0ABT0QEF4_9FLAO|nr:MULTISPECIES: peptidylprolyl isomerase [Flavobacteriaceae]MCL6294355.1 peptidylprolyl isomerase [Jejuia spongiicola]PIA79445.1 hypothetical protein BFR04_00940 [Gaetbulibacter sp. 4G1]
MKKIITFFLGSLLFLLLGCDKKIEEGVMESDLTKDVEMITDFGKIVIRLSDDTPKHQHNFIKLVNNRFYDSIAFHRVIEGFMIQSGNPTSKPNTSFNPDGNPKLSYTLEAEFRPNLFHKRGAIGAAREGDIANPSRSSSGFQFYIVQRSKQTDSTLNKALERVNFMSARNNVINSSKIKPDVDEYIRLMKRNQLINEEDLTDEDSLLFNTLKNKIDSYNMDSLAKIELKNIKQYNYPKAHTDVYKTIGGTPHLDQNYTVFGEVVKGMNIVDSIAKTKTDESDKPINDIRILSVKMIKRKSY